MIARIIRACLEAPLLLLFAAIALIGGGMIAVSRIPVDAIPDIGEKQVIVFAEWPGRSPQNVEDQVTYPLTAGLTGTPGVRVIRSMSGFGFSMVFLVFQDDVDYYWARSRVLERLGTSQDRLPEGVQARLGPDATALGQIFMYTVEGEGFDLAELRSAQDWYIRYQLQSVEGVSEVASIGGYVKQYQVDADPAKLRAFGVTPGELEVAVRAANVEVGAKAIDQNGLEYFVRGVGFIKGPEDLQSAVVRARDGAPVRVSDVATVQLGPDFRRGALDSGGVEAVGGIVTVRFGENPRAVIDRVKRRLREIGPGLPSKTLEGDRLSRVRIVPFYDRTQLIDETVRTLKEALTEELLVTALVVFLFLLHLRTSAAILTTMPLALAAAFIGMWAVGVDAHIMSIAGIAIAIGDVSDMGIIMAENIFRHLSKAPRGESRLEVVYKGATEVGEAIWGAVSNTMVAFLPIFTLTDEEGKLFKPLAYTKSFAILASFVLAITVVPVACLYLLHETRVRRWKAVVVALAVAAPAAVTAHVFLPVGEAADGAGGWPLSIGIGVMIGAALYTVLRERMRPADENPVSRRIYKIYEPSLRWVLAHKAAFLTLPVAIMILGFTTWLGFEKTLGPVVRAADALGLPASGSRPIVALRHAFPGLGREFMPPLDEGSFLFMPSLLPAASLAQSIDAVATQDRAIATVPEVASVVGKVGRAESPLDPAPVTMIETVVVLKPEDQWRTFRTERFWRDWPEWLQPIGRRFFSDVRRITKDEILRELQSKTAIPGVLPTWLQPIQTRLIMLQTGFRAMMGVKIYGRSLPEIEAVAAQMEAILREAPGAVDVVADRIVGKPYVEIEIDRTAIGRYGLNVADVHDLVEQMVGGENVSMTVEGRERYPIRIRYPREGRESIDNLERLVIPSADGTLIPLSAVASVRMRLGPSEIKSENGLLVAYVTLNTRGRDEMSVVEDAERLLQSRVADGSLKLPEGTYWQWAGQFENQVRSTARLSLVVPICLALDFLLLYLSFRKWWVAVLCFSAVPISACGGFLMLLVWQVNLSVAVWVGFIALFGIAEDDAVVMSSYLKDLFAAKTPSTVQEVREMVVEAGLKRIRPCLMTTATTVIGLIPVFTTTGRGSDVMQPMAIPSIGGMAVQLVTLFVTPCVYCAVEEWKLRKRVANAASSDSGVSFAKENRR